MRHNAESPHVSIERRDWSFRRQGEKDKVRHNEKVKEAIKDNLDKVISDGSIITADPKSKKMVKVPMRSLDLPRIKYKDSNQGVGTGDGSENPGDIIGSRPGNRPGQGREAGDQPGVEYYEAELSIEEIQQLVFADLGLPNLRPKKKQSMDSDVVVFDDVRKNKSPSNLDIMRTVEANMRRNAQEHGKAEIKEISPDDYRQRTWREEVKQDNSAVAIFKRDISGSMGEMERYLSRAFAWWSVNFLKTQYPKVETVFIVHDTEAEEVDEEQFFTRGTGGGTRCSSSLVKANEIIDTRYSPEQYNIYPFHFSDGDSWGNEDNEACINEVKKMLAKDISQYAYVQVRQNAYPASLGAAYRRGLKDDRFAIVELNKKEDVLPGLKQVFSVDK